MTSEFKPQNPRLQAERARRLCTLIDELIPIVESRATRFCSIPQGDWIEWGQSLDDEEQKRLLAIDAGIVLTARALGIPVAARLQMIRGEINGEIVLDSNASWLAEMQAVRTLASDMLDCEREQDTPPHDPWSYRDGQFQVSGRTRRITGKQRQVFEILCKSAGKPVKCNALKSAVSGWTDSTNNHTVSVTIGRLKNTLNYVFGDPLISGDQRGDDLFFTLTTPGSHDDHEN